VAQQRVLLLVLVVQVQHPLLLVLRLLEPVAAGVESVPEELLEPVVRVAVVLEVIVALLLLQQERQIPAAVEVVLAIPEVVAVYQAQVAPVS
jgi:hypothetical protein